MAIHKPTHADEALQNLTSGNRRFSAGEASHPRQTPQRRMEVIAEQRPFAAILGCSDSRLAPEIIFDQGLGDLFVVRVAGNFADSIVLGSLELAVVDLGVRLIVVLGHDQCGAVTKAIQLLGFGASAPATSVWTWQHGYQPVQAAPIGHLGYLAMSLKPAVDIASSNAGNFVDNAINANVDRVVELVKTSGPVLAEYVKALGLQVVGARYNHKSGAVSFKKRLE